MHEVDVIIVGGGAAGLMCAIAAGQRGRRVVVLEGSNKIGKKILMSGGGRCNFTNTQTAPENFISSNPHFCKSALSRYSQWDFIALVEAHGIAYHEKTLGQLFCDKSSKDILAMLARECQQAGVTVLTHCADIEVEPGARYRVNCSQGGFSAASLVIASGGLSIPKMGASDLGYRLARQFSLNVLKTRAGLVPFTLTGRLHDMSAKLAGISLRATVSTGDVSFSEDILFTHRGLSGPAMLQVSSYWAPGCSIAIDLMPDNDAAEFLLAAKSTRPNALLRGIFADVLPRSLVTELQAILWPDIAELAVGQISNERLQQLAGQCHRWSIKPAATEGYRTAEVTLGGVDTDELSSKTMECKRHPGLFFIGEVVDVTGHLGGFNFQWAWSSGQAAGQVV